MEIHALLLKKNQASTLIERTIYTKAAPSAKTKIMPLPAFIAKANKKKTTVGNYTNEIRNGMKALIFYITSSNRNGEVSLG